MSCNSALVLGIRTPSSGAKLDVVVPEDILSKLRVNKCPFFNGSGGRGLPREEDGAGGIRRRRVRPASREHYSKRFKRSNAPFVKFDSRRRTARSSARDEK